MRQRARAGRANRGTNLKRGLLFLVPVMAALAVLAIPAGAASGTESIAFESNRFGNSQIFTMNPDGSNVVQLTDDPSSATDTLPSISPNGHTVVYQSDVSGTDQIWAINGDGTNPRQLTTSPGSSVQPTFSPDGTKIAFDSNRFGNFQLFVMNADGSGQTQVMTTDGNVGGSSWSPDGSQIAYNDDTNGTNELYTVAVGTGLVTGPLTTATTDGANTNPHWSPDGSKILFVSDRCNPGGLAQAPLCGGGKSVFLMDTNGENQQNLTQAPIFDADPAWSPDGSKIAFVRDLSGQNFNVFTANADGTNQVQLTNGGAPSRNSFPNWGAQVAGGGQLSGSNDQSVVKPVDLTAAGDSDWAFWGNNSAGGVLPASALTPSETKATGGRQISDLSIVNGDGTPTRGFGGFPDDTLPFNFDWTDGAPDATGTAALGGVAVPALGQGLSFTVPADTSMRRLTIWTSAHFADGTLTAHLSDGSAPDFVQTIHALASSPGPSQNLPAIFTLDYKAASDGQTLTVTWTQSANNGCGGCEDIAIYAAALSTGLSNLTVNATPSSAGAGIDEVPLNTIPNAWLSFFAGSTNSTPVGSTPVGSTPVGSTPVGSTPVGSTPVGSTPVGSTPVGSTPVGSTPVGSTGLFDLPVGSTPVGSTALSSVLLSQIQLHGVTWDQILCGPLLGSPLNSLTLEDVKDSNATCSDNKTSLQHLEALTMSQVDLGTTLLRTVHWSTLLMGNTPLSALPGGFDAWCGTNGEIRNDGGDCTNAGPTTTVLQMDVAGQLGSAPVGSTPVGSTPVGSTPVGSTPVGSTDVTASLLANIRLSQINPLAPVVDCTGSFSCAGETTLGDAYTAGAILPTATFSDIAAAMALNNITINDLVVAIIGAAGFPWEQLPIQGLQPYSATPSQVTYTIGNNVDCSIAPEYVITAHLPKGFFPVNGSALFKVGGNAAQPVGDPTVVGNGAAAAAKNNEYQWTVDCPPDDTSLEAVTLTFEAWVGLTLGTFSTQVTAATGPASISVTGAPVTVHQNPEASDPPSATEIQPDELVAGHIAFSGQQAFYKVNLDGLPTGTKISAFLNVPSGADLDLTMSASAAPSFFTTPVGSTPVGSTPIEDSAVGFSANGLALPPDTLQDVPVGSTPVGSTPVGSTPVGSTSANRGGGVNEDAGIITAGQSGYVTIGVSGYNGATSTSPYVLRVQETPPPAIPPCPARTWPNNTPPSSYPAGALPGSLPTTTKTLFIVDKQRLTAMYGSTAVTTLLNSLNTLAARSEVAGTVLFVDGDANVRSAYSAWDATPCDTTARNNVVRSINDVVASYRNSAAGLPSLHYIVLVGSDEAGPPMADAPDPVLLSPEENEAADLAFTTNGLTKGNALYASAAKNQILTDGAYGAFTNIPWLGRSLLLPQISVSRLVETPGDITDQIGRYLLSSGYTGTPQSGVGTLNPTSALVTGYDFLADGAAAVNANLTANFTGLSSPDTFRPSVPAINNPGADWKASTAYAAGAIVQPITGNPSGLTFQAQNGGISGLLAPDWPTDLGLPVPSDNGIIWKAVVAPWNANDVLTNALNSSNPPSIVSLDAHYNQFELESAAGDLANSGQANAALAARILFTMGCHGGLNISDTLGSATSPVNKYLDWPQLYAQDKAAMYIANTGYGYGDSASVALSERLLALFAKNLHSDSGSVGEEWVNALQKYFATAGAYDVYDEKVMEETTFYGLPFWHFSTPGSSPTFTPLTTSPDPVTGTQSATIAFPGAGATTQSEFGLYRPNMPITSQQVTSSLPARGVWIKTLTSTETNTNAILGYPTIDLAAHEPAPNVSPIFFPASPFTLEHSLAFGNERDYLNVSDQFRPSGSGNAGVQRHFSGGQFEVFYSQSADQVAPLISQVNVSDTSGVATVTARVSRDSGQVAEVAALVNDGSWHYLQLSQSAQDPTLWTGTIPVVLDPEVFVEATDGVNVSYSANKGLNFTSTNSNTPPSGVQILLQAPVGPYAQGQAVNATYQCGSAAAQCIGTVPNGGPIDTSTFGVHTFVVQALDTAGNVIGSLQRNYVVQYPFNGFFSPVDNQPVINVAKAGSAIPVVFSLGGNLGLNIFASGYPKSQMIPCDSTAPADGIDSTLTAGGSSLTYDAGSGRYSYIWKTDKSWAGTCRALILKMNDGTSHRADFKFK